MTFFLEQPRPEPTPRPGPSPASWSGEQQQFGAASDPAFADPQAQPQSSIPPSLGPQSPGQFPHSRSEHRIARIRQHARRVILPALICIAAAGVIGYSSRGFREPEEWLWVALAAAAVGIALGVLPIIAWLRHRYLITTMRTISKRGLLRSVTAEVAHHQVVEVTLRRNWWQALFGSGTIELKIVDGRIFLVRDVPNAFTVAQALRELTGNVNLEH